MHQLLGWLTTQLLGSRAMRGRGPHALANDSRASFRRSMIAVAGLVSPTDMPMSGPRLHFLDQLSVDAAWAVDGDEALAHEWGD